jgi:hypothetical protein
MSVCLIAKIYIEPHAAAAANLFRRLSEINPLTPNDLKRHRAVSPLKIEIPSKKISAGSVARRDFILALKG